MNRFAYWKLGLVVALALVLRGLVLAQSIPLLADDVDQYRGIAQNLVGGDGYSSPVAKQPTAFRPPLYPLLLAVVFSLGGNTLAVGVMQLILGAPTVLFTFAAARRMGMDNGACLAALIVAMDPILLRNTSLVMTETLAACMAAWLLWAVAEANCRRPLMIGALFGLCCLCRPTFVAAGALAVAAFGARWVRARSGMPPAPGCPPQTLRCCAGLVLGTTLAIAPWVVRNVLVFGNPIATTTHGGYTLLLGHNPVYYREVVDRPWGAVWGRESLLRWQESLEVEMARDLADTRDEVARDRWMYRRAWRNIFQDPAHAVRSGLMLVGRLWNIRPLGGSLSAGVGWAIGGFYVACYAGMFLGLFNLRPEEWPHWLPLYDLIVGFTLVHTCYWADMRMRAPLVPAIALLAARGVCGARRVSGSPLPRAATD